MRFSKAKMLAAARVRLPDRAEFDVDLTELYEMESPAMPALLAKHVGPMRAGRQEFEWHRNPVTDAVHIRVRVIDESPRQRFYRSTPGAGY